MFWQASENSEGFGLNVTSYNNPKLDKLLDQAVAVPGCDIPDRIKIYDEVQKILVQERPVDFLLTPNRHLFVSPRLHGLQPGPFAPFTWNVTAWHVQEK
jgi:ABC-type transport system substrate-binding protein